MPSAQLELRLRELTRQLATRLGERFVALALFGSQARGTAGEDSDVDLLLIAHGLSPDLWARDRELARLVAGVGPPGKSIIAVTPEEFTGAFPSYYLDLSLDAVILHDARGYLAGALARIRAITAEAGLERRWLDERRRAYYWAWTKRRPVPGKWAITWEGYHAGA